MSTLYELNGKYLQVLQMIEDGAEGLEDTLESLEDAIEDKAIGYAKVMKNIEAQANAIKEEEKRLADRRKALENNIKRMKDNLQDAMLASDTKRIKTDLFTFNIQNNPPSVKIVDEELIPKHFYEEQAPKLNRRELINALKENDVPGAEITQGQSLRIR